MDSELTKDIAELLHLPPRKNLSFHLVLLFAVLPIWSVIPISWGFVAYCLFSCSIWTFAWYGKLLFAWALCEVIFSVYLYGLARLVSRPHSHGPISLTELQCAFKRSLQAGLASLPKEGSEEEDGGRPSSPTEDIVALEFDDPRAVDFRNYMRTWFGKVPWSSIRRHEMYAWLYWYIYNAPFTSLESLSDAEKTILQDALSLIEKRAGTSISEGSNLDSSPLLLTLDPINVAWRPLVWYAFVAISNHIIRRDLQMKWNVKSDSYNGLQYLLHMPRSWSPETGPRPIVFIHGLGLGLLQYIVFLTQLLRAVPDRPVLILLHPHVSQDIFNRRFLKPMNRHESAECLAGLLRELGWVEQCSAENEEKSEKQETQAHRPSGVTVISHSSGSFTHAWMLKAYPEMIRRSCFVDPVTFCSWEGDLCYNFIYRRSVNGLELLMKYFVGMELGVANFLQRHFDWHANSLWLQDIPNAYDPSKTKFFLGGKDSVVDAERVKRYLTSHGIRKGLWFDPDGRHGQALLTGGEGLKEILRWLRESS
ncbi:unnamed protein product [Somion occarium]|uniref:Uncharacterized protein n=1 Tax=Somion occarium TaxID=3059160 RepID=A0ABP1DKU5_9APHY